MMSSVCMCMFGEVRLQVDLYVKDACMHVVEPCM